jgi:integrase
VGGQRIRASTGIEGNSKGLGRREANDWLKQRQADAKQGIATHDKVTVASLVEELFKHYELNGHQSHDRHRWDLHFAPFFCKCQALDVTATMIRQYVAERKQQKDAHGNAPKAATINREMALLRAAYNLALRDERLRHMPSFKQVMLPEDNVREGFLRDEDYSRLIDEAAKVGLWLRTLLALYYNYGWRKSEARATSEGQSN